MIASSEQQRSAILAEHPEATQPDLDCYIKLMARRLMLPRTPDRGYGVTGAPDLEKTSVDGEISEMQRTLFPRITEALANCGPPRDT